MLPKLSRLTTGPTRSCIAAEKFCRLESAWRFNLLRMLGIARRRLCSKALATTVAPETVMGNLETAFAKNLNIKVGVKKLEMIISRIRGLSAKEALIQLRLSRKKINTPYVIRTLQSAVANATHDHNMDEDRLIIHEIYSGRATPIKRPMYRARGRSSMMMKRRSHLYIKLKEQPYKEGETKIGRWGRRLPEAGKFKYKPGKAWSKEDLPQWKKDVHVLRRGGRPFDHSEMSSTTRK